MTIRQITVANADIKIKRLYETAFPDGEQIPWDDLMRLVGEMPLDFTAYYDDEEFIGFTIVYPRKAFNWYWYFAVCEELRGNLLSITKVRPLFWIWKARHRYVTTRTNASVVTTSTYVTALGTQMYIVPIMTLL